MPHPPPRYAPGDPAPPLPNPRSPRYKEEREAYEDWLMAQPKGPDAGRVTGQAPPPRRSDMPAVPAPGSNAAPTPQTQEFDPPKPSPFLGAGAGAGAGAVYGVEPPLEPRPFDQEAQDFEQKLIEAQEATDNWNQYGADVTPMQDKPPTPEELMMFRYAPQAVARPIPRDEYEIAPRR